MMRLVAAAALAAVGHLNEVEAAGMRLMSKHEVMSKTTIESATRLMLERHQQHQNSRSQELVSLIQEKFGQRKRVLRSDSAAVRHGHSATTAPPTGYAAANAATDMLNQMIKETQDKLMIEEQTCRHFNRSQLRELGIARASVAEFNSDANRARAGVLRASSNMMTINTHMSQTKESLRDHLAQCRDQLKGLNEEIAIVEADLDVMKSVLALTECDDAAAAAAAAASFLQRGARASSSSTALVSCRHCNRGRGLVMLQNSKLQHMLYNLRSKAAHNYLNKHLQLGFQEASKRFKPVALTQVAVAHMRRLAQGARRAQGHHQLSHRGLRRGPVNVSDVPDEPIPYDCTPTDKCTVGAANCQNLKDRFLLVAAGIQDKHAELTSELAQLQEYCDSQETTYKERLKSLESRFSQEQANLATSTGEQNQAESGSKLQAEEFDKLSTEYSDTMGKCCDNHNSLVSEQCALEKIRGELDKLQGTDRFITDCEVSDWSYESCTASCGGGDMRMTRSVLVHPNGGMECPLLESFDVCNDQPCPVDCVVESWSGWSACSAECDGGTMERERQVKVPPANDGEECGALTETTSCNMQACNKDCVLADWSEWTDCSKFCDIGHSRRYRDIAEEAVGTGRCPFPELKERLEFLPCNQMTCASLLSTPDSLVKCENKVDMIILLDGSGSLGSHGWEKSKAFAQDLIASLEGGEEQVKVALMLFSGPRTWDAYYKCIDDDPNVEVDMEEECGIKWVKEFTNDTAQLAVMAGNLEWPAASTLTSVALAEAQAMLIHGREDADSLVVVVTDGQPISPMRTKSAANRLKEKARVLWVPVGPSAPMDVIEELASLPKEDHIVKVDYFFQLDTPDKINQVLATSCNRLEMS